MGEGGIAVLERPPATYQPSPKELQLQNSETSRLQRVEGSPRIWYVDVGENDAGIFKSKYYKGEINSDVEHERAAYLISEIAGFNFVPATVLRSIDGKEGCLQEFAEDAVYYDEVPPETIQDELYKYWIFRHILRNPDGRSDNLLVRDGKVISIDHEASFDSDPPDPSYYDIDMSYYGVKAPGDLVDIFRNFLGDEPKQETLRTALTGLISPRDVEVTMQRLKTIGNLLVEKGQVDHKEELSGENLW